MSSTCLNCGTALHDRYCSHCGQSADTHTINAHFLWHEVQHGFLHVDKGILFTARELFTRPGHSIRGFIEGKRVRHFKPVALVLLLAGIYGFCSHLLHIDVLAGTVRVDSTGPDAGAVQERVKGISEWVAAHYWIVALAQLPLWAAATRLAFFRAGYNYFEHFVLHAYLVGQRLLLHIVALPLHYALNGKPALAAANRVLDWIGILLLVWALFQFFHRVGRGRRILLILLSCLLMLLLVVAVLALAFNIYGRLQR